MLDEKNLIRTAKGFLLCRLFQSRSMPSSPPAAEVPPVKRWRARPPGSRSRKKQKRLDTISENPTASYLAHREAPEDAVLLRRSSRVRRAPDVLDSSPVPSNRRTRRGDLDSLISRRGRKKEKNEETGSGGGQEKGRPVSQETVSSVEGDWRSRLRCRVGKGGGKYSSPSLGSVRLFGEVTKVLKPVKSEETVGLDALFSQGCKRVKRVSVVEVSGAAQGTGTQDDILPLVDDGKNSSPLAEEVSQVELISHVQIGFEQSNELETQNINGSREEDGCVCASIQDKEPLDVVAEVCSVPPQPQEVVDHESNHLVGPLECFDGNALEGKDVLKNDILENKLGLNGNDQNLTVLNGKHATLRIKEGRRCGLCGVGTDGKPPKKLIREYVESENEAFEGSSASEEPDYDVWDGFGDEPGWLGRLLGPIHDRFGIARVWVHLHCAVWSPEVYFAGLGCLKNVRAALCRGRALKCSRCGRPGATIGCRVDRCPKTYHLPCSRAERCIFDHRKFLIACSDHRRFFQPQGTKLSLKIRKMKAKKFRVDLRKISNEAKRKDLEAEEKWLENCGEDEEFLKREGRRLNRDILRIAPTFIGGPSNEKLYQGWESVAGLEHVIECMKEVVILPLLYPEFFKDMGLTPPRGVLLHGYPGTGKTHVVRALIGACSRADKQIAYFARKGADCLGKYVGDAERQLRLLFQVAERSQPSIIFFDEIDGLAPRRSKQQDQTHSSVVSTLLTLLDGLKSRGSVIVIGATNRPDAVDPALRRPGRFDREIYFPLPSEKGRSAILSLHTRSWPKPLSGPLLSWVANQTVGFAGADLQALCTQAAMHALKRNYALQQLLSSAEKGVIQGKLPSLPSFQVEERDWLAALALAPPPCSRRAAGMVASDIVACPLPAHLVPCLLLPLAHILISIYIDERIWLSPVLFDASKFLKKIIISALEQKGLPLALYWSHLSYLIQEPFVADEIEKIFSYYGLIISSSGFSHSNILVEVDEDPDDNVKFNSLRMKPSGVHMQRISIRRGPIQVGKSLGFRMLISGTPGSGQHHLASCLLQGFVGHTEIQKVSLATISQEGRDDMVHGLTQILLKFLDKGSCVIYMPRIDLWAFEESNESDIGEIQVTSVGRRSPSEIWSSFAEQVDSACTAASIVVVATCELENSDLPFGVRQFFSTDTHNQADSTPTVHAIPRFLMHVDGKFDRELAINSAAEKLSYDLVHYYLQLMHQSAHLKYSGDKNLDLPILATEAEADTNSAHIQADTQEHQAQNVKAGKTVTADGTGLYPEKIASCGEASCRNGQHFHGENKRALSQTQPIFLQESFLRTSRGMKGNSILAIATFGYQILRYPQFAELCWVTSKLKEGPCTDISGPWKGWPFNFCVMHVDDSQDKVVPIANSSSAKSMESRGVVRGLVAIGLLAFRGFYTSVREVSADVRKVLGLLVLQMRPKIFGRKDRYYFRILSQVSYVDDMVNSWAFTLQSLQSDNIVTEANSKLMVVGGLQADTQCTNLGDNQSTVDALAVTCNTDQGGSKSSLGSVTGNRECCEGEYLELKGPLQEKRSDVLQFSVFEGIGDHHTIVDNRCDKNNPVLVAQNVEKGNSLGCNDLDTILSSNHSGCFSIQHDSNITPGLCLYKCCSKCVHTIYSMSHNMICDYFKSDGSCSTIDEAHDLIVSCSLKFLTSFRKYCISQISAMSEDCRRELHCQTHFEQEDVNEGFKRSACHCKALEQKELLLAECNCHTRMEREDVLSNDDGSTLVKTSLTYLFRDGVAVPPKALDDYSVLHCNFEKLCVCSVAVMLLTIKQRLD
ncbi:ATPase family AAA domain-containing protein [Apostasia shenzhenica]|uniref:ATPase family AAA domain-containing protein n=1 Tax=Apostasia shenzhenica TaxID=1088818 RepID=A0A2I0A3R2_9ASPA|nr:ATPase family AAA domain-containing protein [Apostasia shenzhenica]